MREAIRARPAFGQVHRAEHGIDQRQVQGEILVDGSRFVSVVPMMKLRRRDQPI
jgi:hypothetical protein